MVLTPSQYPWTNGSGVQVPSDGLGGSKPDAGSGDGIGGAGMVSMDGRLTALAMVVALAFASMY